MIDIKSFILKFYRLFISLIIISVLFYFVYQKFSDNIDSFIGIGAILIAILALIQEKIISWIFYPVIKISFRNLQTPVDQKDIESYGKYGKYINMTLKNVGLSKAINLKAKIRSSSDREWVHLRQPFMACENRIVINNLSVNEDEDFNIGRIYSKIENFEVFPFPKANNQILDLSKGSDHTYQIKITGDNINMKMFNIRIKNDGFTSDDFIEKL